MNVASYDVPNKQLVETPGVCVKRHLNLGSRNINLESPSSGLTALQFEPSAVIIDETRDLMIVASLDEIIALPAGLPNDEASINAEMKILHRFPPGSEDLEALEIIDGKIYAISEKKQNPNGKNDFGFSHLIQMEWADDGLLTETNRWLIESPNAVSYVWCRLITEAEEFVC